MWSGCDSPFVWDEDLSYAQLPHHLNYSFHSSLVRYLKRRLHTYTQGAVSHITLITPVTQYTNHTAHPLTGSMSPLKLTLGAWDSSSWFILRAESMKYTRLSSVIPSSLNATWSGGENNFYYTHIITMSIHIQLNTRCTRSDPDPNSSADRPLYHKHV